MLRGVVTANLLLLNTSLLLESSLSPTRKSSLSRQNTSYRIPLQLPSKIDATEEGDLAGEFDVGGYPTLKFFKNGNRDNGIEYGGGRQADDIVSWLIKKSGPAAIELSGADAAKAAVADNDVIVVINGQLFLDSLQLAIFILENLTRS